MQQRGDRGSHERRRGDARDRRHAIAGNERDGGPERGGHRGRDRGRQRRRCEPGLVRRRPHGAPGTPVLVDPFTSAGIATTVDTGAHAVDPSTYRTTIPGKDYTSVYVVFALKPDAVGKVTMVMTFGDTNVAAPLTIDYGTVNSWGDFKINFTADGIPPGIYKAVMTYEPTGAQVIQYFAVN